MAKTKENNRILLIVLSILLGCFGVDRFVCGKTGTGVLKLLTLGGFLVWWIIDIVFACTGRLGEIKSS